MNRKFLVEHIAANAQISKAAAERALSATLDGIACTLADGNDMRLVGFGTFSIKTRAARTGRNPQTGEPMTLAASRKAAFKPGKELNARLSES